MALLRMIMNMYTQGINGTALILHMRMSLAIWLWAWFLGEHHIAGEGVVRRICRVRQL